MADWVTISALATAGGTLVLAAATVASVGSANRSAKATERALLAGMYGDHQGGQRTITRFVLLPHNNGWLASVTRHWNLDRSDPR